MAIVTGDRGKAHGRRGRGRVNGRIALDVLLAVAGVGVAVWRLAPTLASVDNLGARFTSLRWSWVAVAIVLAVASLVTVSCIVGSFAAPVCMCVEARCRQ
ncbi:MULTISPECIES: hypothetical protein [unclassified Amycolatopsis]|uniref:hypothetical protein n=1 Tax=unclassified Amycolatopsis TaxID=2618356 RepID=UPI001C69D783|nr:hypothetical protein [Amycolatopsis sp. DSM 110486]QYN20286.1 hypothetical protein K1T34_48495 [Amycolatopsis sp. DSM 110486]